MARPNPKPPKRGRPPEIPGEARIIRVGVVLSARELSAVRDRARREGVSVSTFIRLHGVPA